MQEQQGALASVERACRWMCWSVEGIGARRLDALVDAADSALAARWHDEVWWDAQCAALRLTARVREQLASAREGAPEARMAAQLASVPGQRVLWVGDQAYPAALRTLADPPAFVCVLGEEAVLQASRPTLALVGSRDAPARTLAWSRALSATLARHGVVIVSGGARGMDAAAHEGALSAGGRTVVVLPGGLDRLAPARHRALFSRVAAQGGALLSEYPPGVSARRHHFTRRNRLIAALGQGVVVLRAGARSGTMLTAEAARKLGRPVGAVPVDVQDREGAGALTLLASGAAIIRDDADALQMINAGALATPEPSHDPSPELTSNTPHDTPRDTPRVVTSRDAAPARSAPVIALPEHLRAPGEACLGLLRRQAHALADELARVMGLRAQEALPVLLELELCGAIRRDASGVGYRAGE